MELSPEYSEFICKSCEDELILVENIRKEFCRINNFWLQFIKSQKDTKNLIEYENESAVDSQTEIDDYFDEPLLEPMEIGGWTNNYEIPTNDLYTCDICDKRSIKTRYSLLIVLV